MVLSSRIMEQDDLFGSLLFKRQPFVGSSCSSLSNYSQQRRSIVSTSSVTSASNRMPLQYKCRPSSDIGDNKKKSSPEAEAIDRWFENIQRYEQMLEQVAAASLDQGFKDELHSINQWLKCRSDAERTATLYTIVQNASQIQIRFLITVLEQLAGQQEVQQQQQQQYYNLFNTSSSSSSVISNHHHRQPPPRTTTAMSEPATRRTRQDLFVSRPLGLSHPGPLYEKALAARAQLKQVMHNGSSLSSTLSSCSSSSSSSSSLTSNNNRTTKSLFSTSTCSSPTSLFSNNDWPFPLKEETTTVVDKSWSFGSLGATTTTTTTKKNKQKDVLPWAIQEEQEVVGTLEQAKARLLDIPPPVKQKEEKEEEEEEESDSESDTPPLTGVARRRKRSSAARALKDKLAAETVDFNLMKNVQDWLKSLRLHKYGHAFIGLNWKQVIRMSDQDMIDQGVNTIGARRKLLKVFENVQHHCNANGIEY